ncbi:hypothetical protein ACIBG7_03860 [Nonomuraea sp. NPDC050328]|uniref:hypothetical protein n=1 Tax=Nonomuraea sp. NPDC050328 TaxID=3364361 RepID=UPI0037B7EF6B
MRRFLASLVGLVVTVAPGVVRAEAWGGADLSVRVTPEPRVAQPGQPILYRVTVRNAGPGDAVLPVLRVTIPTGVDVVNVNVATCRPGRTVNEVVCPSPTDVLAGGSGEVRIGGVVQAKAKGPLRATATLTSEVKDDNEADNTHVASTPVDEGADLRLRLSHAGPYELEAEVRNRGPRAAQRAFVAFRTGAGRFLTATGAACHHRAGHVLCRLREIGSGGVARLRLALRPSRQPVTANVYSTRLGDRHPANNVARLRPRP